MQISSLTGRLLFTLACLLSAPMALSSAALAEDKIALCHAGLITLPTFEQHIEALLEAKRYAREEVDALISRQRAGGPEFFTSQIIIQEGQSGSGTFSLRLFHGLSDAATKYRNVSACACVGDDYPIVYFVGFRVRKIEDGTILVSREDDVVNVISLKALDAKLRKHIKVKIFEGDKILCRDLGAGCDKSIFYGRYSS